MNLDNNKKSLYDISWKISEEKYRKDTALSYSILAKYERGGFNSLPSLFDKVESPSLTFGSAVDALITGGREEFEKRFIVVDFPKISDNLITVINKLYENCNKSYSTLDSIPDIIVAEIAKNCKFWEADKWDSRRAKEVKKEEGCHTYYALLQDCGDKEILSMSMYQDVADAVTALKDSEATKWYFEENNPFNPNIERLYQLKFKATLKNIDYRIMADELIVDYKNKTIQPIDLKTSSHFEWDFYKSFIDYNYAIQARLYYRVLLDNISRDSYFKDFKLLPYQFIVINKKTLTPLVWTYGDTVRYGDIMYGTNRQIVCRDPFTIGQELEYYLKTISKVPVNINVYMPNSLEYWLDNM